jgi:hypothetical protein
VDSPSGRHLVSVPTDAAVEDLLPALVLECEGGPDADGWSLAPQGEPALVAGQSLGEIGLFPGAVLVLTAPEPVVTVRPAPRPPRIASMREADYGHMLDAAIAARNAPASAVVAVVAGRPGAGATTVTALLATALNTLRNDTLVAVDANPESGALSHWLVPDGALAGDVYRSLFSPEVTPAEVSRALASAAPRLAVVPAPLDAAGDRIGDSAGWERLIEHLRRLHHTVVIDCGTRRGVAASADLVVVVNKYGQAPAASHWIQKPAVVVTNQAPRRARIRDREITIAAEPAAAARLKRRGFAWSDAPPAWQEAIRELAAVLVGSS